MSFYLRTAYLISRLYLDTNEITYDIYSEPCPTMLAERVIQTIIDRVQAQNFMTAEHILRNKYPQYQFPQYVYYSHFNPL